MKKLVIIALLWSIPAYTGEGAAEEAAAEARVKTTQDALEKAMAQREEDAKKLQKEQADEERARAKVADAQKAVTAAEKNPQQKSAAQLNLQDAQQALSTASENVNKAQAILDTSWTAFSDAQKVAIQAQADLSKMTLPGTSGTEIETPFTNATDSLSAINTAQMDPSVTTAITTLLPAIKSQSDTFANLQGQAEALAKSGDPVGMRKLQDQMADLIVEISKNSSLTQKNATLDAITKDLLDTVVASFNAEIEKLGQRAAQIDSLTQKKMSWWDKLTYNFGQWISGASGNVDLAASEDIGFKPYDFEKQPIADYVDAAKQIVAEKKTNPADYNAFLNETEAARGLAACNGTLKAKDVRNSLGLDRLTALGPDAAPRIWTASKPATPLRSAQDTLLSCGLFRDGLFINNGIKPADGTEQEFLDFYSQWFTKVKEILAQAPLQITNENFRDLQLLMTINETASTNPLPGHPALGSADLKGPQSFLFLTSPTRDLLSRAYNTGKDIPVDSVAAQQVVIELMKNNLYTP